MNVVHQAVGFILNTIGYIGIVVALFVPEWRRSDSSSTSSSVLESVDRHQGLWLMCIDYPTGKTECEPFATLIGLPHAVQQARTQCIAACIIGIPGFVFSLLGMKCISCMDKRPKTKICISIFGAVCFGVAGAAIGAAVHQYSKQIRLMNERKLFAFNDYSDSFYDKGACIFLGSAAMAVLLLGSLMTVIGTFV